MKRIIFILYITSLFSFSQNNSKSYKEGEFLKYKVSYGVLNAGFASLSVENYLRGKNTIYHVIGKGWSTGMVDFFFPVNDDYQTYFDKQTKLPYHFIRKIEEGGYRNHKEIFFNFNELQATVINHKHKTEKSYPIEKDVQDLLSSLYYLREMNFDTLNDGDMFTVKTFFDQEIYKIKIVLVKRDIIKTKFGKVKTLVFKPLVLEGRVFKDKETVTLWITDDKNKIPIKIKASVIVGVLKAELIEYKGLTNSFPIIFN